MKAKDIKPGEVYAYQRGKYDMPKPIVFLAPADPQHVYSANMRRGGSKFEHSPASSKPQRRRAWEDTDYGYAAVIARTRPIGEGPVDPEALKGATLDEFLAAESVTDSTRGFDFMVVTSTAAIVGVYSEVVAEQEREEAALKEAQGRETHDRRAALARAATLTATLASLGITATSDDDWHPAALTFSFDEVDKLLAPLPVSEED